MVPTRSYRETAIVMMGILAVAAIACAPMLRQGAPMGHNIGYNLTWLTHFSNQVAQGDIYPRWLMNMNRGAGSPDFYFYGPLPFYVTSMVKFITPGLQTLKQLAWGECLLIFLSGVTFFLYARARFETATAFCGAALYMTRS